METPNKSLSSSTMKAFLRKTAEGFLSLVTPTRLAVILISSFFFWFLAFGDQGLYQLKELMEMKSKLSLEQKKINEEIDHIAKQKEILSDPKKLEMVIRNELGYIKPGEVVFEEKPAESKKQTAEAENDEVIKSAE
ncbi:MAG: Septum formation initiator [bacterium ADurb.Bin270]|nr:MAG: Septum formation initiator [bacterium ADurb.Bin270]